MQLDHSDLDAQLSLLGEPHANALQLARTYAGVLASLAEVDQALTALYAQGAPPREHIPAARQAPRKPAPASVVPAPASVVPAPASVALAPEPAPAPAPELPPARDEEASSFRGPPRSEEIALPEPVIRAPSVPPKSGELSLHEEAVPQSGSFALQSAGDQLDEDGDADFEAEFAALSGADHSGPLPRPLSSSRAAQDSVPQLTASEVNSSASASSAQAEAAPEAAPLAIDLEELAQAQQDADETDAVLALFDSAEQISEAPQKPLSLAPAAHPSWRARPSSPDSRDPDAEFDALFDEASQPSGLPSSRRPGADSVDDLLRDLGAPRMPSDLQAAVASQANHAGNMELELEDPTELFDMRALDSMRPAVETKAEIFPDDADLPSSDFEIIIDDLVDEAEVQGALASSSAKSPTSSSTKPPKLPESRPGLLGRLFKGPK